MDYKCVEVSRSIWGVPKIKADLHNFLADAYSRNFLNRDMEGDSRFEALVAATTRGAVFSVIKDIPEKVKDSYISLEEEESEDSNHRAEYYTALAGDPRLWGVPRLVQQAQDVVRNAITAGNLDEVVGKNMEDALSKAKTRGEVWGAINAVPASVKDHCIDSAYPDDSRRQEYVAASGDTSPWNLLELRARGAQILEGAFIDGALDEAYYSSKIGELMGVRTRGGIFTVIEEVPSSIKDSCFADLAPGSTYTRTSNPASSQKTGRKEKKLIFATTALITVSGILAGLSFMGVWGSISPGPENALESPAPAAATEPALLTEAVAEKTLIPVASITLPQTIQIAPGKEHQLIPVISPENARDTSLVWSSSNPAIAIVSSDGTVSAKSGGSILITVMANDGSGALATCNIMVSAPVPAPAPPSQHVYINDLDRKAFQIESYRNAALVLYPSVIGGKPVLMLEGLGKAGLSPDAYFHNRIGTDMQPGKYRTLKITVYLPASLCGHKETVARFKPVLNNWEIEFAPRTITGGDLKRIGATPWAEMELAFAIPKTEEIHDLQFLMSLADISNSDFPDSAIAALGRPHFD